MFAFSDGAFVERASTTFPPYALGVALWDGEYDGMRALWLRLTDKDGELLPIGADHARRADEEARRADGAVRRAERLADRLRALGVDPDE